MAKTGIKTYLIAVAGILLFTTMLLKVSIDVAEANSIEQEDIIGSEFTYTLLTTATNQMTSTAEIWKAIFTQKLSLKTFILAGELLFSGILTILVGVFTFILLPFTLIADIGINILHIDPLIVAVSLVVLIIGLVFEGWKLLKVGE